MATTTLLQLVAVAVVALLLRQAVTRASAAEQQQQPAPPPLLVARPGCRDKCGNITVPYPFGIGAGCYRDDGLGGFELECDDTRSPPRLSGRGIQLAGFNLATGEARAYLNVTRSCYNSSGGITSSTRGSNYMSLSGTHYRFSAAKNLLISLGCPTIGYFVDGSGYSISGCMSVCRPANYTTIPGLCTGVGCCRSAIPPGVDFYEPYTFDFARGEGDPVMFRTNTTACRYVFLAEAEWLNTTYSDHAYLNRSGDFTVPLVLDWAVRSAGDCEAARGNATAWMCPSANTMCIDSTNGQGYRCSCLDGYEGNPYLEGGCRDIDECALPGQCRFGVCTNIAGGYNCLCPRGASGNPFMENGCTKSSLGLNIGLGVGIGVGLLVLVLGAAFVTRRIKHQRARKLKQKFFNQNRGHLLKQLVSQNADIAERMIIPLVELEKATNNFDKDREIGGGGHGTVYKGILSDLHVVAIKKSKVAVQREIDEFINEVAILSQTNHKNVVRLFGCCLETEVPLLVYEFISNGTLYDHLHVEGPTSLLWQDRLRIATETARALAYLHMAVSVPIVHRDVKSHNILLDGSLTAKVSDFGASRCIPQDETSVATAIQGTLGYLDPMYYYTGRLTEKSDVYSFGVVLIELLTRRKPNLYRSPEDDGLIAQFTSFLAHGNLSDVLDPQVMEEGGKEVSEVASLATVCVKLKAEDRPTMRQVEMTLESIQESLQHVKLHGASTKRSKDKQMAATFSNNIMEGRISKESSTQYSLEEEYLLSARYPR